MQEEGWHWEGGVAGQGFGSGRGEGVEIAGRDLQQLRLVAQGL